MPHMNVASRTEEVDDMTRASIRKFHEKDHRLYEYAKMLFQKEESLMALKTRTATSSQVALSKRGQSQIQKGPLISINH
jgi:hypothetical protein